MRAGNREHVAVLQHILGQPTRTGRVRQAAIQHCFDDFNPATHDIADDDAVGLNLQLRGVKALMNLHAEITQLRAHWRVYVFVAAGYFEAGCPRQRSDPTHEGAANTENVNMHACHLSGGNVSVNNMLQDENRDRNRQPGIPVTVNRARDDVTLD